MASKRFQEKEHGQVTKERTKSPLSVEVSQENHFNELSYKVDSHNTSVVCASLKPENTAGSEVMTRLANILSSCQSLL